MTDDTQKPGPAEQGTGSGDNAASESSKIPGKWTISLDASFDASLAVKFAQRFGSPNIVAISEQRVFSHVADTSVEAAINFLNTKPGTNFYFCPALLGDDKFVGKPEKPDCLGSRDAWVDIDPPKAMTDPAELEVWREQALAEIKSSPLPFPQLIVFSGRGLWLFWRFRELLPAKIIEAINYALANHFGGGDHCHNIDRIARLPHTRNGKTGKVACIWYEDDGFTRPEDLPYLEPTEQTDRNIDLGDLGDATSVDAAQFRDLIAALSCGDEEKKKLLQYVFEPQKINEGRREPLNTHDRSAVMFSWCIKALLAGMSPSDVRNCIISSELGAISAHLLDYKKCLPSRRAFTAARHVKRACEKAAEFGWPKKPVPITEKECLEDLNKKHAVLTQEGSKVRVLSWERTEEYGKEIPVLQSFDDFRNRYFNRQVGIFQSTC